MIERMFGKDQRRILLLGLDAAGKTTILYKLNSGEAVHTLPTIGFNVERVEYKNIEFNAWDIGGQKKVYVHRSVGASFRGDQLPSTKIPKFRDSVPSFFSSSHNPPLPPRSEPFGTTTTKTQMPSSSWLTAMTRRAWRRHRKSSTPSWATTACATQSS